MMRTFLLIFLLFILTASSQTIAQYNEDNFSLSLNYNYTTTSKLFLNPNSPDPVLSSSYLELNDIGSLSAELRYRFTESLLLGLNYEYIKKSVSNINVRVNGIILEMKEGYIVTPVELTLYYILPFSTTHFKFIMGGGGGLYFGSEIRNLLEASVNNISRKIGYGIHVVTNIDYLFNDHIALRWQMRFRDPEFQMKSQYNTQAVTYQNRKVLLPPSPFETKVNIDGITFSFGIAIIL
ncbi:hypothetical protein ABRY23_11880 [Melioribacteraceae bacterium 4301-Me]|uniref:hypothetical protein n=1 Tax=Pyranulibacter aquaticus TaxID=3163344 RepID=UPI003594CD5D